VAGAHASPGGRRFAVAALAGSLAALLVFVALLIGPERSLVNDNGLLGSFYDVQARALLDGHLDVDPRDVSIEGFRIDGRTYTYFGLVPALLRMPVLLVTHDLDGELTRLSMLLACVVLLAGGALLQWRVRRLLAPERPVERADLAAAALVQLVLGAGAITLYLAGRAVVYHEAELWGAAFAVSALAAIVSVIADAAPRAIAWAGLLAALALNTRFSVGLAPVAALAVLALGATAGLWTRERGRRLMQWAGSFGPRGGGRAAVALLAAAVLVPLAVHGVVNAAKFGQPFGIPIEKQVQSQGDPSRRAALAANDGTIFGVKFVPTTLLQAVRPDAVGDVRAFPFVGLPAGQATVVGDVRFDTIDPSLSAVTSMPALLTLTLVGLVGLARRPDQRPLLGVLVATVSGFVVTLTIAFVTTRYLADFLPFLALGAVIGLQLLLNSGRRRGVVLAAVAVLAGVGLAVNGGAALVEQRLYYEAAEGERAGFVKAQDDVDRFLDRRPRGLTQRAELPLSASGSPGDLLVVRDCAALYVQGPQRDWLPVERTPRGGLHRLTVRFPAQPAGAPEVLLRFDTKPQPVAVTVTRRGTLARFSVRVGREDVATSRELPVTAGAELPVVISRDRLAGGTFVAVDVSGRRAITGLVPEVANAPFRLGAGSGGVRSFAGEIRAERASAPVCRELMRRERGG
jgi:hypothetical protein